MLDAFGYTCTQAVGIKNGASSVAGGASIGPGGVFVYTSPLSQAAKSGSAATVEVWPAFLLSALLLAFF